MSVIEEWVARTEEFLSSSHARRKGVALAGEGLKEKFGDFFGPSLEAALEHLPEDEPSLAIAIAHTYSWLPRPEAPMGSGEDRKMTHAIAVITHRRVLGIEKWGARFAKGREEKRFIEREIRLLQHFERHIPGGGDPEKSLHDIHLDFGGKKMCIALLAPDDAGRFLDVLRDLTGG